MAFGFWGRQMSLFVEESDRIRNSLGLEWEPVAVKFSDVADDRGESQRKLRACEAFDVVRRENAIINLSKENCICPGGRHFLGLEMLPNETVAAVWTKAHKAYESMKTAIASVSKQPQPVKRGSFIIVSPLAKVRTDPDMVLLFANPEQADRILGLVSFNGAEPFSYYPISNVCSIVTHTLAKGRPEINFLATHARHLAKWSPNELIIAMPHKDLKEAVKNIPNSGFGTAKTETPRV
jgi:uncharacterized protein (DUF169 family)